MIAHGLTATAAVATRTLTTAVALLGDATIVFWSFGRMALPAPRRPLSRSCGMNCSGSTETG
jgi:hypothetical protein